MSDRITIAGGGLAGLACAYHLNRQGIDCTIHEASDRLGGRCGSDRIDGFTLDRGFQVFLDSYPEARSVLDLDALALRSFVPGALIYFDGKLHRFVDPFRVPTAALQTALSPAATFGDKLRVAKLRAEVTREGGDRSNVPTIDRLRRSGFSDTIIDRFFKPFYGGVFLERELATSSRMFDFTFRMFAAGNATLPAKGMQAIVDQLAGKLTRTEIRLNARLDPIDVIDTDRPTVIATDVDAAAAMLSDPALPRQGKWTGTTCLYFAADRSPLREPILVLNGEPGTGPVNHVCVPSDVQPSYAPAGQSLISCSAIGVEHADLERRAVEQLEQWFGNQVRQWRHLKTYRIEKALPDQSPAAYDPVQRDVRVRTGLYVAGDHRDTASINGALAAGRRAAEAVLAD